MSKELQIVCRCDNETCHSVSVMPYTLGMIRDPIPVGWHLVGGEKLFCCQAHADLQDSLEKTFDDWYEKDCPPETGLTSAREQLFAAFLAGYRFSSSGRE